MTVDPQLVETLAQNAGLVATIGTLYWFITPRIIRASLSNGGGEVVRRIVHEENAAQSRETAEGIATVRERLAVLEARLSDHLAACPRGRTASA